MTRSIGLLLLLPFASFAAQAFLGDGGFAFRADAWGNTLLIASLATGIALLFGLPVACVLAHGRGGWKVALTLLPLLLPPVIPATAWIEMAAPVE